MSTKDKDPKPFETASATTDPDNSNSGPFAYIITGVCIAGLLVFGICCSSCASVVLTAAGSGMSGAGQSGPTSTPLQDDGFNLEEFEQWLEQYSNPNANGTDYGSNSDTSSTQNESGVVSVAEALDFDLAPYQSSLDAEVSASSYAGTPSEVRDYVRSLVNTDKDYTQQVINALNEAALKEDVRADKVKAAVALCSEASAALGKVKLPSIQNDTDGAVSDALGTAKTKAQERWDQMERELSLLDTQDQVQTRKLWNYDGDVRDATQEAGDLLEDAMDQAAKL